MLAGDSPASAAAGRGQPGMAQGVELGAVQLGERTGKGVEAEGVAFLEDDTAGLPQTSTTSGST